MIWQCIACRCSSRSGVISFTSTRETSIFILPPFSAILSLKVGPSFPPCPSALLSDLPWREDGKDAVGTNGRAAPAQYFECSPEGVAPARLSVVPSVGPDRLD